MAIISQGVFVLAIVWTLWQLVRVRRQLRSGAIVVPPLVAATLVFALGIIVVIITGVSPLHLLWWFPCSFIVGLVVLVFPLGTHLLLRFLVLFAGSMESSERPQPQAWRGTRVGRGKRKRRHSARAPRRTRHWSGRGKSWRFFPAAHRQRWADVEVKLYEERPWNQT